MKKIRLMAVLLVLVSLFALTIPVSAQPEQDTSVSNGCFGLMANRPIAGSEKLLETAKAVILLERNSNTMVYSYNPDGKIDTHGMNKIMTALLALEYADPDDQVTVKQKYWIYTPAGSVSAGLDKGETIKMIDLLYCMMVGSANDAASVIAEYVAGDFESFVVMMNQRAKELGCTNTNFVNAHGIQAEGQYTTARDLAIITEAALENEIFKKVFSTAKYTVPATNKSAARELVTSNNMMRANNKDYYDPRVTGGRTGSGLLTERSLICTAQQSGSDYLVLVMGATAIVSEDGFVVERFGSFEETRELLNFAFDGYEVFNVLRKDHVIAQIPVSGAENHVPVGPSEDMFVALPKIAMFQELDYRFRKDLDISMPVKKGYSVGTMEVWYQSVCVARCEMLAMADVYHEGERLEVLTDRVADPKGVWITVMLIGGAVVMFGIAGTAITVIVVRKVRKYKQENAGKMKHRG